MTVRMLLLLLGMIGCVACTERVDDKAGDGAGLSCMDPAAQQCGSDCSGPGRYCLPSPTEAGYCQCLTPATADACTTELDGSQCCNAGDNSFCTGGPNSIACNFLSGECLGEYHEVKHGGACLNDAPCRTE